jgi:hypothetical protein
MRSFERKKKRFLLTKKNNNKLVNNLLFVLNLNEFLLNDYNVLEDILLLLYLRIIKDYDQIFSVNQL